MSYNNAHALDLVASNTGLARRADYGLIQDGTFEGIQPEQIPDEPTIHTARVHRTRKAPLPPARLTACDHLGSIDQPLTDVVSADHCLAVFHDILHTQLNMCEKKAPHRGFSMYDCSDLPRHILYEGKTEGGRKGRTGTPMFIATELANPKGAYHNDMHPLEVVASHLEAIENDAPEAFKAAFPRGDDGFMRKFLKVAEQESARRTSAKRRGKISQPRNPAVTHELRHDVESAYWGLLWGVSRARPRNSEPEAPTSDNAIAFDTFCRAMLLHEVDGARKEADRLMYLKSSHLEEPFFHPDLDSPELQNLFIDLAVYLSIPWHLYADDTDAHAHVALRRLILGHLFSEEDEVVNVLDIPLDTEQPRSTTAVTTSGARKHSQLAPGWAPHAQSQASGGSHDLVPRRPSTQENELASEAVGSSAAAASSRGNRRLQKRAHDGGDDESEPRAKKLKISTSNEDYERAVTDLVRGRSASSLRLQLWKDRSLWFRSGRTEADSTL